MQYLKDQRIGINGRYLTKFPLKIVSWTSLIWKENRLYTVEEDEDGYQYVKRYKVTWNY